METDDNKNEKFDKYKKEVRVWLPHPNKVWQSAVILEDYDRNQNQLLVKADLSTEPEILNISSAETLPPLHLSEDSPWQIKSSLSSLTVVHEATVLNVLQSRFTECTYGYCGNSITVALNPYDQSFQDEENEDILRTQESLSTFVFDTAENVYTKLERENYDQTIIFTGESGSGKSFNANRATWLLAKIGSKEDRVKDKILASSVVLQAFGNAGTILNENSSRFGRFIQIQYDKYFHTTGALLTTYYLDCSNIVSQEPQRKLFNIFYYLNAAKEEHSKLQLNESQFDHLESNSDDVGLVAHNKTCFIKTITAFRELGFSEEELRDVLQILVVLVHLQNVPFKKPDETIDSGTRVHFQLKLLEEVLGLTEEKYEACSIADQNKVQILMKALRIDEEMLDDIQEGMCYKTLSRDNEEILQPMNLDQATKARDNLIKFIYTKLFNWLVMRINASLLSPRRCKNFIGILDMHGFENFHSNSFEQFCFNYIDEVIDQFFIQLNLRLEQEAYVIEKIEWEVVRFECNDPYIRIIEAQYGIFDLLNNEAELIGNNLSWLNKLCPGFDTRPYFARSPENAAQFTIVHFTGAVQYDATDFLIKNHESVDNGQLNIFKATKIKLLNKFFVDELSKLNNSKAIRKFHVNKAAPTRKTVTSELRTSLAVLAATLSKTRLYFVRCIKSNNEKEYLKFDSQLVAEQLRTYNIIQIIKISAQGYFQNFRFEAFVQRYYGIREFQTVYSTDMRELCKLILDECEEYILGDYKIGETRVFLREYAVNYLEDLRDNEREDAACLIQKKVRPFLRKKMSFKVQPPLKRLGRGYMVRRRIKVNRESMILKYIAIIKNQYINYILKELAVPEDPYSIAPNNSAGGNVSFTTQRKIDFKEAIAEIQRYARTYLGRKKLKFSYITTIQRYFDDLIGSRLAIKKAIEDNVRNFFIFRQRYVNESQEIVETAGESLPTMKNKNRGHINDADCSPRKKRRVHDPSLLTELNSNVEAVSSTKRTVTMCSEKRNPGTSNAHKKTNRRLFQQKKSVSTARRNVGAENKHRVVTCIIRRSRRQFMHTKQFVNRAIHTHLIRKKLEYTRNVTVPEYFVTLKLQAFFHEFLVSRLYKYGRRPSKTPKEYKRHLSSYYSTDTGALGIRTHIRDFLAHRKYIISLRNMIIGMSYVKRYLVMSVIRKMQSREAAMPFAINRNVITNLYALRKRLSELVQLHFSPEAIVGLNSIILENHKCTYCKNRILHYILFNKMKTLRNYGTLCPRSQLLDYFAGKEDREIKVVQHTAYLEDEEMEVLMSAYGMGNPLQNRRADIDKADEVYKESVDLIVGYIYNPYEDECLELLKLSDKSIDLEVACNLDSEMSLELPQTNVKYNLRKCSHKPMGSGYSLIAGESPDDEPPKKNFKKRVRERIVIPETSTTNTKKKLQEAKFENDIPVWLDTDLAAYEFDLRNTKQLVIYLTGLNPTIFIKNRGRISSELPAQILIMCIRYADYEYNYPAARSIIVDYAKQVVKRDENFHTKVFWLHNTYQLLNYLKQYSKCAGPYRQFSEFHNKNTTRQNHQQLKNLDLHDTWRFLEDTCNFLALRIQNEIMSCDFIPFTAKALIHEKQEKINMFFLIFSAYYEPFGIFNVHTYTVTQIFKPVLERICFATFNNIISLQKVYICRIALGIKKRLLNLDSWIINRYLSSMLNTLNPLHQQLTLISQLPTTLNGISSIEDAQKIYDTLSCSQILHIVKLYNSTCFMRYLRSKRINFNKVKKWEEQIKQHPNRKDAIMLMVPKEWEQLGYPFRKSDVALETVEIPQFFSLPVELKKV